MRRLSECARCGKHVWTVRVTSADNWCVEYLRRRIYPKHRVASSLCGESNCGLYPG